MDRVYLQAFGLYFTFWAIALVAVGVIELVRHHC